MKNIEFIFFDMGYTLVNEDEVWAVRCKEQADTYEAKKYGITADMLLRDIRSAADAFLPQWKTVMAKYGFTNSAKYKSEYETLYEDALYVLEKLSKRFKLGIIANQSSGLSERLRNWAIDKYFTAVVSSADYEFSKPDKRLFGAALEKCGCSAHKAVMVGDRLDNDILPANELGFTTVRIKQGFAKNQTAASENYIPKYEIDNLTQLLDLPFVSDRR